MNRKIVLLFSVLLAVLAVVLMQMYKRNLAKELGVSGTAQVILAAKEDIPAYSEIDQSQLRLVEYPQNFLPPHNMNKEMFNDVVGQTTLFRVKAGNPILSTDLASTQSEAQLSRVVAKNMRALALPVDKVNSFGGLLKPNDHVDILGTFQKPGSGDVETVTLLQNVTVLSVGGKLGAGRSDPSDSGKGRKSRVSTVTVLVTPVEAELLVFAQDRGSLGLTMRGEDDVNAEMRLDGKSFADIFEPEVRQQIQKARNKRVTKKVEPGINIQTGSSKKRRRKK